PDFTLFPYTTLFRSRLTPNRQAPMTGPRPMQTGTIFPQRPLHDLRPQTPTGPRVEQVGPLAQQPNPVLRSQEPSGSTVLQPSQRSEEHTSELQSLAY